MTGRPPSSKGTERPREPRVYAVADIGSNSTHLLVAVSDGVRQEAVIDESAGSDLGHLVERRGVIGGRATRETIEVLRQFKERAGRLGAEQFCVVATEPLRRAADRRAVQREIGEEIGTTLEVLSHEEEGLLTVLGLVHGHAYSKSLLVADVGGGSTEVVALHPAKAPESFGFSVGSARLLARVSYQDPPRAREWQELRRHAQISLADLRVRNIPRIVLVGGSATRLIRLVPQAMLDREISREDLATMGSILASSTAKEIAGQYAISQRRARLLPAGIAIIEALLQQTAVREEHIDDGGIREGAINAIALRGARWKSSLPDLVGRARGAV